MPLSKQDLIVIPFDDPLIKFIQTNRAIDLFESVKEWFKHPELSPVNARRTWSDYATEFSGKNYKTGIVNRIYLDWPNGLTMYQIAQLSVHRIKRLGYDGALTLWEIKAKDLDNVKGEIEPNKFRQQLYEQLDAFYKCHIYILPNDEQQMDWFRISIFESQEDTQLPSSGSVIQFARFRHTPFIIKYGGGIKELLQTIYKLMAPLLGADSIIGRNIRERKFEKIAAFAKHHDTLGSLTQFLENEVDSNPLDLRGQLTKRPKQEEYVSGRERRRRIVPLDRELIQGRYKNITETFGTQVVQGVKTVRIHTDTSIKDTLDPSIANALSEDTLRLKLKITIKGNNVMEGFRQLALKGKFKTPVPSWMVDMASQGANTIYVTEDGVMKEVDEDDEVDEG